jgi:hypothetical protein
VLRYTVTGSFDGYMWQALERKARFIAQVMHGRTGTREISDIGDAALSFSEIKALATGNPLLIDKAEADAELARLQRAERAHYRNQDALEYAIRRHQADLQALTLLAADLDLAITRRQDTRGDAFTMTVGDRRHTKRPDAGRHLKELLEREIARLDGVRMRAAHPGYLGGFPLTAAAERSLGKTTVSLTFDGIPRATVQMSADDLRAADPAGLVTRLENRLHRLEERKTEAVAGIERARREIAHAQQNLGQPFPQAAQLTQARGRARHIDEQLSQLATEHQASDTAASHQPGHGHDARPQPQAPPPRSATRETVAAYEQPAGAVPAPAPNLDAVHGTAGYGQQVPQPDGGQAFHGLSPDPATARPQTSGPKPPPPAHQLEPDPPRPSAVNDATTEAWQSDPPSRPWTAPHAPSPRTVPGRQDGPHAERKHNLSGRSPADRQHAHGADDHQLRPPDWQDHLSGTEHETWVPRPIQPPITAAFHHSEYGGPELEA